MSSIGKNIRAVIPELARAKVVEQREYELKSSGGLQGTGYMIREQRLDLTGDGKADVVVERTTDVKTGRFSDSYTLQNSNRIRHDKVIFHADQSGIVRGEFHRDPDRQVNLWDSNLDGKVDGKSVRTPDGTLVQRDDSDGNGTIDRERTLSPDGTFSQKSITTDPFFEDEN